MEWHNKPEVRKGRLGEAIVRHYLESRGWIVYEPVTEAPHGFDKLAVREKKQMVIAEVKTKARMTQWAATGFDRCHLREYEHIQQKYGIDVFVFFVDEHLRKVYGQSLSRLLQPHDNADGHWPRYLTTREGREIVLFALDAMTDIARLSDDNVDTLASLSRRQHPYPSGEVKP